MVDTFAIPSLPYEIWWYVARVSSFHVRKIVRALCAQNWYIPLRLPFPHQCFLCQKEPFVPVKLRFQWKGDNKSGFCKFAPFFCWRCARAWVRVGVSQSCLQCTCGCCRVAVKQVDGKTAIVSDSGDAKFTIHMGYGDWPRRGHDLCHIEEHLWLDQHGVGCLRCNICNTVFYNHSDAISHMQYVCNSPPDEYLLLDTLCREKMRVKW